MRLPTLARLASFQARYTDKCAALHRGPQLHALWARLWQRACTLPTPSHAGNALYAARLAALYEAFGARSDRALHAIYDPREVERDALGLWADPFGAWLVRNPEATASVRSFAEAYAASYGHTLDDVATAVQDAREAHHSVWAEAVTLLTPQRDTRAALERISRDLEEIMTQPSPALTPQQAAELCEALAPVAEYVERMLRATHDLDATATHLTLVRSRLTDET
jgi:hypothetical protein